MNIHCGKKLAGKMNDEILEAILKNFKSVVAVQQSLEVIRVTFLDEGCAREVLKENGVHLCGMLCRMTGGPPSTIIHLFDYPYEEDEVEIEEFLGDFGVVKDACNQRYLRKSDIHMGTI